MEKDAIPLSRRRTSEARDPKSSDQASSADWPAFNTTVNPARGNPEPEYYNARTPQLKNPRPSTPCNNTQNKPHIHPQIPDNLPLALSVCLQEQRRQSHRGPRGPALGRAEGGSWGVGGGSSGAQGVDGDRMCGLMSSVYMDVGVTVEMLIFASSHKHLSVCACLPPVRPLVRPSVRASSVDSSMGLFMCLSFRLSVCPSVRLTVCPSVGRSVGLSVCRSVCRSVCLSVCCIWLRM